MAGGFGQVGQAAAAAVRLVFDVIPSRLGQTVAGAAGGDPVAGLAARLDHQADARLRLSAELCGRMPAHLARAKGEISGASSRAAAYMPLLAPSISSLSDLCGVC